MEVIWTNQSIIQLNSYADFIAKDNVIAAQKWVSTLLNKTDQIVQLPRSGRIVPEYGDPNLREIIEGDYRLIYRIKGVKVVRVVHSSYSLVVKVKSYHTPYFLIILFVL